MSAAFGFLAWILTAGAALRSKKMMFIALLFVLPFLPRYIGFSIGSDNFALTWRRIILITILCIVLSKMLLAKRIFLEKPYLYFGSFYLITVVASTASGLWHGFSISILIRCFENIATLMLGTLIGHTAVKLIGFKKLVKYVFVFPLYVIIPLAFLERFYGFSLFYELFGTDVYAVSLGSSAYQVRNEAIRTQVSFENSLLLSEFLALSMPMLFYMLGKEWRWKWVLLIGGTCTTILFTGSRTGLLMLSIIFLLQIMFVSVRWKPKIRRFVITLAIIASLITITALIGFKLWSFQFVESFVYFDTAEERSTYSRLQQYPVILTFLRENPFIGLGYVRNHTETIGIAIDNYYLWTALEGGVIGVLGVFSMIFMTIRTALALTSRRHVDEMVQIAFAIVSFTTVFAIQKAFLQSQVHLVYFFVFSGALLAGSGGSLSPGKQGAQGLHTPKIEPKNLILLRLRSLPEAPKDREHVWQIE